MTREQFKQNLEEALEYHDGYISEEELETFLDLNYDEDSSITDWTFADFNCFALDVSCEGMRRACHLSDLQWDDEDDEEEDEE